ncbi:KipI family sensor histidine kinase inhibitor [Deinococcus metalli]|uniref:KipI family sensor histidine kinase inhibitor n=1 Tax=Deinococcus metalli TaxID=1141878 RepID=A0A7W8KED7_9DEIO|nr:5-oxoprolinase subunit PxpB [Deinococcus metalli]MBB5376647.1 KipI family sensor histidine kinase inhibitor [Deinococcus metalli]GHF42532.1 urea carboxylase [Deinococcus metalli]
MRLEGFYVQFSPVIDSAQNLRLHALHRRLREQIPDGVTELQPGYGNLYVEFDAERLRREEVQEWVRRALASLPATAGAEGRQVEIPVRYDGEDLPDVATRTGLTPAEVIRRHSGADYHVYALGFTPGFPFLGEVDPALRLPRRDTPRAQVPFNAVAIAQAQSCVYALPSPGGWNLLGTALTLLYDPNRAGPFLLAPGDRVRFVPAEGATPTLPAVRELWPARPHTPILEVVRPGLLDVLVDGGRFHQAHTGMARSGPLDAPAADNANRSAGNPPGTPLLELTLLGPVLRALRSVTVGIAGQGMTPLVDGQPVPEAGRVRLREGQVLSFAPSPVGVRAYLAVAGGVQTVPFLGSSSVDRTGLIGRPLARGDVLGAAGLDAGAPLRPSAPEPGDRAEGRSGVVTLRLRPGPQASLEALRALADGVFTVGTQDRMGVRFEGPPVPGGQVVSEGTPHGAVQVTPAGQPILLLNDRGRIGGYHKPAVLHPDDLPRAAQLRPNQRVRFQPFVSGPPDTWAAPWFLPALPHSPEGSSQ